MTGAFSGCELPGREHLGREFVGKLPKVGSQPTNSEQKCNKILTGVISCEYFIYISNS